MISISYIVDRVIDTSLKHLAARMSARVYSAEAIHMLLAIGWQESGFEYRSQINGPAKGFWQFEQMGGVRGVLRHEVTSEYAAIVCKDMGYRPDEKVVYRAIEHNDLLACAFARLLLWADPRPLPDPIKDPEAAWEYYLRNWRPGKPHKDRWSKAIEFVKGI